jgi:phosphohistidine phosphatase
MNIYVLRHGIAGKRVASDARADRLRPLTPKGRKRMEGIALAMKRMGLSFDLILSSPFVRARQTAEIVAQAFRARKRLTFFPGLAAGVSPEALLEKLGHQHLLPEDLLLVGHEPQLSSFVSLLVSGSTHLPLQLKKGGLCKLSLPSLRSHRRALLEWLLTPKQMLAMR